MHIEPLESRLAPAGFAVTYTDVDGDKVTILITKGDAAHLLVDKAAAGPLGGEQLRKLDFQGFAGFTGASITITARPQDVNGDGRPEGDGLVNLSLIDATGLDLAAVRIGGTIGGVNARHVALFSADQVGTFESTLATFSQITGRLGSVMTSGAFSGTLTAGSIGSLRVGSITGEISAGKIDSVMIAGNLTGQLSTTGGGAIGPVTIGGSFEGNLKSDGALGAVRIVGDAAGITLSSKGKMASLTIGGSLGTGIFGMKVTTGGTSEMGPVRIGGDMKGSQHSPGAILSAGGKLASVTIGGSLVGSIADGSAQILSGVGLAGAPGGDMGPVRIGHDIVGGAGRESAKILAGGNLASLTVGGSVIGGSAAYNTLTAPGDTSAEGQVFVLGALGPVKIGGALHGGAGASSAQIRALGSISSVTIGDSLQGGAGAGSGAIVSLGSLGAVKIGRDLLGGSGSQSGRIFSLGDMAGVSLGGSFVGGDFDGAATSNTGTIIAQGALGSVRIQGDVQAGRPYNRDLDRTAYIEASRIGSVYIGGSIYGGSANGTGALTNAAAIRAFNDIGSVTIRGDVVGVEGTLAENPSISARGIEGLTDPLKRDLAIGSIAIGGRVSRASFLAGYTPAGVAVNADAQIGSVTVGRSWAQADLVAGVSDGGDGIFGNSNDTKITNTGQTGFKDLADTTAGGHSQIASVIIHGRALGDTDSAGTRTWAITAQQLVAIKVGGAVTPLLAGATHDRLPLAPSLAGQGASFDFNAIEV